MNCGVFPNLPVDLGDGNPVFNIDRLGGFEQARAFAMNRVTWPVLFGYVVENMLTGTGILMAVAFVFMFRIVKVEV